MSRKKYEDGEFLSPILSFFFSLSLSLSILWRNNPTRV